MNKMWRITLDQLNALLEDLSRLYSRIASVLIRMRTDRSNCGDGDTVDVNFFARFRNDILSRESRRLPAGHSTERPTGMPFVGETEVPGMSRVVRNSVVVTGKQVFNGLSAWLKTLGASPAVEPHIAEKLKKRAEEHINRAMRLARQGEFRVAQVHVDLAESAVKTAAHYMTVDAFGAFKNTVGDRLASIDEQRGRRDA